MLKSKIESKYEIHDCQRISQGDILRDIDFILVGDNEELLQVEFQYVIVITQDCDLQQGNNILSPDIKCDGDCRLFNQFLHSVLFIPAFPAELVRSGDYLESIYKIKANKINSALWKQLKQNQNPRYHFFDSDIDYQVPELVSDFKAYYSLPFNYFIKKHQKHYLATINELFRESLSQRFSNFLNRIGLPDIPIKENIL